MSSWYAVYFLPKEVGSHLYNCHFYSNQYYHTTWRIWGIIPARVFSALGENPTGFIIPNCFEDIPHSRLFFTLHAPAAEVIYEDGSISASLPAWMTPELHKDQTELHVWSSVRANPELHCFFDWVSFHCPPFFSYSLCRGNKLIDYVGNCFCQFVDKIIKLALSLWRVWLYSVQHRPSVVQDSSFSDMNTRPLVSQTSHLLISWEGWNKKMRKTNKKINNHIAYVV